MNQLTLNIEDMSDIEFKVKRIISQVPIEFWTSQLKYLIKSRGELEGKERIFFEAFVLSVINQSPLRNRIDMLEYLLDCQSSASPDIPMFAKTLALEIPVQALGKKQELLKKTLESGEGQERNLAGLLLHKYEAQ